MNQYDTLYLDISAKGSEVWAVFCNNTVVRAEMGPGGEFQAWKAVPLTGIPANHKVITLGASADGYTWALTNYYDGNNIYRYQVDTMTWLNNPGNVDQIGSFDKQWLISINRHNDGYWASNWGIADLKHKGTWSAIGLDKSRWLVDIKGRVNRCVDATSWCPGNLWQVMCARTATTVEAQNKDRAVMTTKTGELFLWDGKDWNQVPFNGRVTRASVTDNWVFFLNQKGNAFYANV